MASGAQANNSSVSEGGRWEKLEELNWEELPAFLPALVLLVLVAVTGLVGNSLVLHVYGRKLRSGTTRCFVLSLAVVDLLTCTVCVAGELAVIRFYFNFDADVLCRLLIFLEATFSLTSGFLVIAMTIERYRRLCWITRRPVGLRGAWLMIGGACLLGGACAAPYLALAGTENPGGGAELSLRKSLCQSLRSGNHPQLRRAYAIFLLIAFLVSYAALIILYARIALMLWRRRFALTSPRSCSSLDSAPSEAQGAGCLSSRFPCWRGLSFLRCFGQDGGESSTGTAKGDSSRCCRHRPCLLASCCCRPLRGGRQGKAEITTPARRSRASTSSSTNQDDPPSGGFRMCESSSPYAAAHDDWSVVDLPTTAMAPGESEAGETELAASALPAKSAPVGCSGSSRRDFRRKSSAAQVSFAGDFSTSSLDCLQRSGSDDVSARGCCGQEDSSETPSDRSPGGKGGCPERPESAASSPRSTTPFPSSRQPRSRVQSRTGRTTLIIVVIGLALMVSYVPFLIATLVRETRENFLGSITQPQKAAFHFFLRSYFIQAMVNPVIYSFLNIPFRKECKKLFC